MENFIKGFIRDRRGIWRCVEPATLNLPEGRVQVTPGTVLVAGSKFMNVDLAARLEEQYRKGRPPR